MGRMRADGLAGRRARVVSQRLQIWVVGGRPLDCFGVNGGGLAKPLAGVVEEAELSAVAGQVVGNGPDARKEFQPGPELVVSLLGSLQFMQGERSMDPGFRALRTELDHPLRDHQTRLPLFGLGVQVPAQFEHIGMRAGQGRQVLQFQFSLSWIAQLQPALGGAQMKVVRMWQV